MSKFGDDDRRGRGPGKPFAGGGKPYGGGGGKSFGGGGKPYGGGKPAGAGGPKPYGAGAPKPWQKRDDAGADRPRGPRVERFGREERPAGASPYGQRTEGERKPFQRREGGDTGRPPYQRREGGDTGRPPFQRREGGDTGRPPFQRREGGDTGRPPFQRREGGDTGRPPFQRREGGDTGRPPYQRREGAEGERSFKRRDEQPFSDRPRREGGFGGDSGERAPKRFGSGDRPRYDSGDRPRRTQGEGDSRSQRPRDPGYSAGNDELRQYGWNACMATYRLRPDAVRKVYLHATRIDAMREILQELAERQIGYRVVENEDLEKLTQTQHHEGICFDILPPDVLTLDDVIARAEGPAKCWLVWLDGVGNPHNLGAILRSAAHFGCAGVVVHRDANLKLSGAAARVAEGGAEVVPLVRIGDTRGAVEKLRNSGFKLFATSVRDGESLFDAELPHKLVWLMGAEGEGVSSSMQELADQQLRIPGTGQIESLNVAAAFAVFAAETRRAQQ